MSHPLAPPIGGKTLQLREKRTKMLLQFGIALSQRRQCTMQWIGARQSPPQPGEHLLDDVRVGICCRQVIGLHDCDEASQTLGQPGIVPVQTRAQACGKLPQRGIRPGRKIPRQAVIEPHIQHDWRVAPPWRSEQPPRSGNLGVAIGETVYRTMQCNARAQPLRQSRVDRSTGEITQHTTHFQLGIVTSQEGVRQKIHASACPITVLVIILVMSATPSASAPTQFPADATSFLLTGPAGKLEVAVDCPAAGTARQGTAVICHPHPLQGGTMRNKVVTMLERALRESGLATVRFNFRGVGQSEGEYAEGKGEADDLAAVTNWVRDAQPQDALWLAGFSFGSMVALTSVSHLQADALITVAPPIDRGYGLEALSLPDCPWLVIQGEEDEVVDADSVFAWLDKIPRQPTLVRMPETGHFFHRRLMDLRGAVKNGVRHWLPAEREP